jgi:hypothetical protein
MEGRPPAEPLRPASAAELATARVAERIAIIAGLAVALRLLIFHRLSTMWVVIAVVGLVGYAYSVYRRRI